MNEALPNAKQIRAKLLLERRRREQDEKEERLYARWLLFGKGRGQSKNLNTKEKMFVSSVAKKTYERYVSDMLHGTKTRVNHRGKGSIMRLKTPPSFLTYRRIWYGGAKSCYIRYDVPTITKMRMEALRNASGNPEMCEFQGGRWMQELGRAISERERRGMGIPLRDLHADSSCEQGRSERPQQLRERREKTPAGNRDATTVGKA